ncbi:MAG TPA: mechanosensitive ion channel family protein [Gemmatimonadales bacterium]|nr:mechanosensitive ion channel family protein [Gemmatimonadales bacterium]
MLLVVLFPRWLENFAALFGSDAKAVLASGLRVLGIWLLAWLALWTVRLIARRIEQRVDDGNDLVTTAREKRGRTLSQLIRGAGRVIVVGGALLLTLRVFMDIGPILAAAGILGLAVSFGAQSLVKDIISGFFMLLEDQFGVGDVIEAAGLSGTVEQLTLRVVMLRSLDGTLHIIPNGEITTVSNKTRSWSRAVVDVGIGYEADLDHALAIFNDEAARFSKDPAWAQRLDSPLEVPGVERLDNSAVIIRVLARTQPGSQWEVARAFRLAIKKRLDAEGISIPFPQMTVHLVRDGDGA